MSSTPARKWHKPIPGCLGKIDPSNRPWTNSSTIIPCWETCQLQPRTLSTVLVPAWKSFLPLLSLEPAFLWGWGWWCPPDPPPALPRGWRLWCPPNPPSASNDLKQLQNQTCCLHLSLPFLPLIQTEVVCIGVQLESAGKSGWKQVLSCNVSRMEELAGNLAAGAPTRMPEMLGWVW